MRWSRLGAVLTSSARPAVLPRTPPGAAPPAAPPRSATAPSTARPTAVMQKHEHMNTWTQEHKNTSLLPQADATAPARCSQGGAAVQNAPVRTATFATRNSQGKSKPTDCQGIQQILASLKKTLLVLRGWQLRAKLSPLPSLSLTASCKSCTISDYRNFIPIEYFPTVKRASIVFRFSFFSFHFRQC